MRDAVDGRFEVEEAGTFELKGIAEPQVLYTARAASAGATAAADEPAA